MGTWGKGPFDDDTAMDFLIGESLEDAVRREVLEEVGVAVCTDDFVGSQPWPFPAGLMIGFRATAMDECCAPPAARSATPGGVGAGPSGRVDRAATVHGRR